MIYVPMFERVVQQRSVCVFYLKPRRIRWIAAAALWLRLRFEIQVGMAWLEPVGAMSVGSSGVNRLAGRYRNWLGVNDIRCGYKDGDWLELGQL